jgi:hypothetical protein
LKDVKGNADRVEFPEDTREPDRAATLREFDDNLLRL